VTSRLQDHFTHGWWLRHLYRHELGIVWASGPRARWIYARSAFRQNLSHFTPALFGIGFKLDPKRTTDPPKHETAVYIRLWLLGLAFAGASAHFGHETPLIGFVFFWLSPLWLYCLQPLDDIVFEYRAYLALLGWGVLIAELPYIMSIPCVLFWAVQSWRRSFAFRTQRTFAERCFKEYPESRRAAHNLKILRDMDIARQAGQYIAEGKAVPADLRAQHGPVGAEARP